MRRARLAGAGLAVAIGIAGTAIGAGEPGRETFRRPSAIPFPASNPYSPAKAELGRQLFGDPRLSASGTIACISCHDPKHGWTDPRGQSVGEPGVPLDRRAPGLWNTAFGELFFWDGRAANLEAQARGPIESPSEMALPLAVARDRLASDPDFLAAYAAAFPQAPEPTEAGILAALATFERTLVAPRTRFDAWVEGDDAALSKREKRGWALFTGKTGCAHCHEGWAFTDHAFHDIGLPGEDAGRGAVLGQAMLDHAFKTPSLREIGRRGPYMHDGSRRSLAAVLEHYEHGVVERPSLSPDLKRFKLTGAERADLLAFLRTLTAELARPDALPAVTVEEPPAASEPAPVVGQRDKRFAPRVVRLPADQALRIVNDDLRAHNVRVHDPKLKLDTGLQEPGQSVYVRFPELGRYYLFCGIHPTMKLIVDVAGPP